MTATSRSPRRKHPDRLSCLLTEKNVGMHWTANTAALSCCRPHRSEADRLAQALWRLKPGRCEEAGSCHGPQPSVRSSSTSLNSEGEEGETHSGVSHLKSIVPPSIGTVCVFMNILLWAVGLRCSSAARPSRLDTTGAFVYLLYSRSTVSDS